jgi:hypothetical protein
VQASTKIRFRQERFLDFLFFFKDKAYSIFYD